MSEAADYVKGYRERVLRPRQWTSRQDCFELFVAAGSGQVSIVEAMAVVEDQMNLQNYIGMEFGMKNPLVAGDYIKDHPFEFKASNAGNVASGVAAPTLEKNAPPKN